ncbi:MAG: CRISPR-associated endonuclease Cas1 [Candidatus Brocadiaceae bacterium]|nr:CRISPR-associated endonuclease Cas1 [Candidatus Brocadiaceae bacterium]
MATIYLTEQGSKLSKTSKRLIIEKDGQTLLEIPDFKIERVLIFGNVQITTQAMAFLLDNGIEVSFLSLYGKYRGRLSPVESKNAHLRIRQYQRHLDNEFRLVLAKAIVQAKLHNGRELLMRYARNHPEIDFEEDKKQLEDCIAKLRHKESVNSAMGVEGAAAAVYFKAFGKMLRGELKFEKRQRRPPKDPVNALLSLGYTLIGNEMHSIVCAIGFDPYIGFFHGVDYGRPSLALDLIEPFRHAIIDRFTLYLLNTHILSEGDFTDRGEEGVFLSDNARKRYFAEYEKYMTKKVISNLHDDKKAYRDLFKIQAHAMHTATLDEKDFDAYRIMD